MRQNVKKIMYTYIYMNYVYVYVYMYIYRVYNVIGM